MSVLPKILFFAFLVLISVFLSLSEISIISSRKFKLNQLIEDGNENARKILDIQEKPGNFFAALQIGLNAVAILAGIYGEKLLGPVIDYFLSGFFPNHPNQVSSAANIISFLFITWIFIQFADLIPKRIAMVYAEKMAVKLVSSMLFFIKIMNPIIVVINGIASLFLKIFKIKQIREDSVTQDDIIAMVEAGAEAGVVLQKEHSLIGNVFELDNRWVSSIMTSRDQISFLTLVNTEQEMKNIIIENPHTKFLVCKDELDSVVGYINSKDILSRVLNGEHFIGDIKEKYNKNLLVIPNTLTLSEALDRFNDAKDDFAIIINEYGYVVGLVTMKDVLNTLMGDYIYNKQSDEQIILKDENSWIIEGITAIEEVKKVLPLEKFPEEDSYETISGFMMYMLKNIPKVSAKIEYENYSFEVISIDNFKIDKILVTLIEVKTNK